MDVKQVLADAWEAVESSGVPEPLHPVAFEQAVRLLTGESRETSASNAPAQSRDTSDRTSKRKGRVAAEQQDAPSTIGLITDEDAFFAKFAEESGLEDEKLRSIYYLKDGRVRLNLSRRVLGQSLAEKNRTVALLTLGAKHYVNGDMALKITEVRDAIEQHGYDPTRNLSKHLDDIPGTQAVGARSDRAVRVQNGRFDEPFKALIEKLTAN